VISSRSCVSLMCTRGECPTIMPPLERDDFSSSRHSALSFCLSMISGQTLRVCPEGKPVPTFPDHALIEFKDGHGSRDGDLIEPRSRPSTPKGAAAIGGAAPIPESGPLGGVHQSPELRAPIRNTADGAVLAEPLFLAEFCNTPMAGAV
jgi:hypothetical protein